MEKNARFLSEICQGEDRKERKTGGSIYVETLPRAKARKEGRKERKKIKPHAFTSPQSAILISFLGREKKSTSSFCSLRHRPRLS